jgi:hypothetical protein
VEEYGYVLVKGIWGYRAVARILDRDISIAPTKWWQHRYQVRDETGGNTIAELKINVWTFTARIMLDGQEFIWRQNIWGKGTWWWEAINGNGSPPRESIKAKVGNHLFAQKGRLHLAKAEDENLNAMISAGLFMKIIHDEAAMAAAGA